MATNSTVTFTHNIWTSSNSPSTGWQYEKYDTKGIAFDLTSLHNYAVEYTVIVAAYVTNDIYKVTRDVDIGLKPYTTGQSTPIGGTSTTTLRTTVEFPAYWDDYLTMTFTYTTNASNQSSCLDKPFYICNYGILNANGQSLYYPVIDQVVRKYSIPIPAAGDKITHSDLAAFATWCKMTGSATHTTANTSIAAADSNRPWGTSVTMINNSGSSVATSSTYSKTAGTSIQPSWISSALSACNNRVWTK